MLGTRFKILITITSNSEDLTKPNIQRETYIDPTLRLHNVMNHKYSIRSEAAAILAKRIISFSGPRLLRELPFSNPPHDDQSKLSWVERVQKGIKKGGAATYSPSLFHRNNQNQNQNQNKPNQNQKGRCVTYSPSLFHRNPPHNLFLCRLKHLHNPYHFH